MHKFFGRAPDPFAQMAKESEKLKSQAEPYVFKCACMPIPENDGKVENYRDGKKMVTCDRCSIRSHRTCNKVKNTVVTWVCPDCAKAAKKASGKKKPKAASPAAEENLSPNVEAAPASEPVTKKDQEPTASGEPQQQQDAWNVYADRKGKAEEEGGLRRAAAAPAQKPIKLAGGASAAGEGGGEEDADEKKGAEDPETAGMSAYELERLARIKRNKEMMAKLNLAQAARDCAEAAAAEAAGQSLGTLNGRSVVVYKPRNTAKARKPKGPSGAEASSSEPMARRSSKRLRAPDPEAGAEGGGAEGVGAGLGDPEDDDTPALMTLGAYYEMKGIEPGPLMKGQFEGWVEDGVRGRLGIAATSADAWAGGGGGQYKRKLSGGESAKERSRKMMCKNPNEFFYRHVEPGEEQWKGEWSLKEVEHFVEVAKKHGCGSKWGLFSSHIPHRVGYQCSAVYRQVVIPNGLLQDNNFKISASGICQWAPP